MLLRLVSPIFVALCLGCALLATTTPVSADNCGTCVPAPPPQTGPGTSVLARPTVRTQLVYTNSANIATAVAVPPEAVTQSTWLRYTVLTTTAPLPAHTTQVGPGFALDAFPNGEPAPDFTFAVPPTITIPYRDEEVTGLDENSLTLTYWDGSAWQDVLTACAPELTLRRAPRQGPPCDICQPAPEPVEYTRDPANNRLTVPLCHLTEFALVGRAPAQLYVPLLWGE